MKFYLTTAIPYVNGKPHIGHALEFVQTDTIARWHRRMGDEVVLLTGADENSLKNVRAAEDAGVPVKEHLDKYAAVWKEFSSLLNISVDVFQRSFNPETHFPGVQKLWSLCDNAGDIYKKAYKGLYCVGCERYYKESELIDGKCPVHLTVPEVVDEENYFFKLSKYQGQIRQLIESDTVFVTPAKVKNEMLAFIDRGLEDFSVSRSLSRARGVGVPVPNDQTQVMYVWFDALAIYITGIGYGLDEQRFEHLWPADIHVIGKDIVRFHAIYWIGMLLSSKLPLPKTIMTHGFITSGGQKMSKSIGNVIDPYAVVERYGADFARYYLLSEIPTLDDGDFTFQRADELYASAFANGLGNLVSRICALAEKSGAAYPVASAYTMNPKIGEAIATYDLRQALLIAWDHIAVMDKQINETEPWKKSGSELAVIMQPLIESLRQLAVDLEPFLPDLAVKIQNAVQKEMIEKVTPLFPRRSSE